jgi:ABC-type multidrug transport system ATPase subunit
MNTAIQVSHIYKSYLEVQALNDINLEIKEGELFGIIGPDGAGKSTLFRILATLILPKEGEVSMLGLDVIRDYDKIRNIIGYMPGRFSLYQDLTVEENLNLFASIFGTTIKEQYELIKDIYIQIEPFKDRRAGKLSGGMKQKLALCCALVHKPSILLLDEPTTGVDPVSRKEFWGMLKRLQKWGITIVVSTPYMDEAVLCERVALIQDGNILSVEKPQTIIDRFPRALYAVRSDSKAKLLRDLKQYQNTASAFAFGESIHYSDINEDFDPNQLIKDLESKGHRDIEIAKTAATIEDCFIELMKTDNE